MRSLYFKGKLSEDDWMKYQDERPEEEKYAKPYSQILREVLSEYVETKVAESVKITSSGNNVKSGCNHSMSEYYYTYYNRPLYI
ncbi:MAG: hypothetical protein VB118_07390 [Oscillospiraceae bacterium]|nr:hypothetical protein [Oscillospiraceae bacterium]